MPQISRLIGLAYGLAVVVVLSAAVFCITFLVHLQERFGVQRLLEHASLAGGVFCFCFSLCSEAFRENEGGCALAHYCSVVCVSFQARRYGITLYVQLQHFSLNESFKYAPYFPNCLLVLQKYAC